MNKRKQPIFCLKCKMPFNWKDYIASYTADDKNINVCIPCQNKAMKEKENG
jgi:hypothetical protein